MRPIRLAGGQSGRTFLQQHRFPGRSVLIPMLTFPLAFPASWSVSHSSATLSAVPKQSHQAEADPCLFIYGLFLGYLFSIPRVILTVMAV